MLSIQPAANKPIRLAGWIIGQTTELGDAAEEALRITVRHLAATVTIGSGGSAVTPVKTDQNDVACGATTRCNDTTVSTTTGANTVMQEMAWNIRSSPWERYIPEEQRPRVVNGEALIVRMESTPIDDIGVNMTFFIEEL